jgi:hypothetical protein
MEISGFNGHVFYCEDIDANAEAGAADKSKTLGWHNRKPDASIIDDVRSIESDRG